ncbi:hypothetical protein Emin_0965 [Elusimicrobium minutum Pei191]|uniref:Uncharacterized protein n=1 Tax=Elusimicrobium minutum (strain Pei191) TaxID=445932 RepID=B2KDC2_ELUMP|nr:hypothetical protein [Elusimicrobium minutum]ACC98518.1 hypothetical protein Emin_0965 [Elusimicrobium minutum Pei191]
MQRKIKELYLQFQIIGAALKKIAELTRQDLNEEGATISIINKWVLNNRADMEKLAKEQEVDL